MKIGQGGTLVEEICNYIQNIGEDKHLELQMNAIMCNCMAFNRKAAKTASVVGGLKLNIGQFLLSIFKYDTVP